MHNQTFEFESDFVDTLRCVPMAVRMKLDHCRIKLTLRQWSQLSPSARRELLDLPCEDADSADIYRRRLVNLVAGQDQPTLSGLAEDQLTPKPAANAPPLQVTGFVASKGLPPMAIDAWRSLSDLQRFTLIKLSRDNHDNVMFVPALHEFGLLPAMPTAHPV